MLIQDFFCPLEVNCIASLCCCTNCILSGFFCFFIQDFLHEMSQKDEKVDYLVNMGFPEDEVTMAITRCGMLPITSVCLRFFSKISIFFQKP